MSVERGEPGQRGQGTAGRRGLHRRDSREAGPQNDGGRPAPAPTGGAHPPQRALCQFPWLVRIASPGGQVWRCQPL